jgi:ABC-2 type transport system permease protein
LVSALLPSIWQIFIVIVTVISFGTLVKEKKDKDFFNTKYIFSKILGKLFPYTIAFMILGVGYIFYIYGVKNWYFAGSFGITFFAMFLTIVGYQAVALGLFVTGFDYARSLSLGAVYTAPAFAFLGVTFPASNMNQFASFWRDILPVSHFIEIQISQANYGAPVWYEVTNLTHLFLFWLVFVPVVIRFKKRYVL